MGTGCANSLSFSLSLSLSFLRLVTLTCSTCMRVRDLPLPRLSTDHHKTSSFVRWERRYAGQLRNIAKRIWDDRYLFKRPGYLHSVLAPFREKFVVTSKLIQMLHDKVWHPHLLVVWNTFFFKLDFVFLFLRKLHVSEDVYLHFILVDNFETVIIFYV